MIPDVQHNTTTQEVQRIPAVSPPPASSVASPPRNWSLLLRILGVVVAVVGGGLLSLPSPLPLAVWVVQPVLLGLIAALLIRAWWALFVVPIAFLAGFFVVASLQMHGFNLQAWFTSGLGDVDILLLLVVPNVLGIVIGAVIGTPLGALIEMRRRH